VIRARRELPLPSEEKLRHGFSANGALPRSSRPFSKIARRHGDRGERGRRAFLFSMLWHCYEADRQTDRPTGLLPDSASSRFSLAPDRFLISPSLSLSLSLSPSFGDIVTHTLILFSRFLERRGENRETRRTCEPS